MKRYSVIGMLCTVLAVSFTSCLGRALSSPELFISSVLVRTTPSGIQDTLRLVDSLCIGDTLRLGVVLNSGYNTLTSFTVQADSTAIRAALEVDSAVAESLSPQSDLENGKLIFIPEQSVVCVARLRLVPRRPGVHPISMTVSSDAGEGYSPRTYTYTPVVK